MGEQWLDDLRRADSRRAHPIQYMLLQQGNAWSRWRDTFDAAVGIVTRLVASDPGAQTRLIAKLRDRRQFWATVPEIVWAARLDRLDMRVTVEPIVGRAGPDLLLEVTGFSAYAEIYAPEFKAHEFDWGTIDMDPLLAEIDEPPLVPSTLPIAPSGHERQALRGLLALSNNSLIRSPLASSRSAA
jgi:hypothetical protein